VVDLMAALEASVKAAKEARGRHPVTNEPAAAVADVEADDVKPAKVARARKSA
jgi:hypothetical protein